MNVDDLDRIFPIVDGPSAQLMKVKALCLNDAGVITAMQKVVIDRRADAVLARAANWVEGNPRRRSLAIDIKAARRHDAVQKMHPALFDRPSAAQHQHSQYGAARPRTIRLKR